MREYRNNYIIKKVYLSFVVVSVLSAITATVGMLIDNIMVGSFLGTSSLGAMGIVGPVALIVSAVGNICSGGGSTRAAQAMGKGNTQQVNEIFTITVFFAVIIGTIITVAGIVLAPEIAGILGAKGELMEPSTDYLRGYFIGTVPTILLTALSAFVKIDGSRKLPLAGIGVMCGANILLDLVVILVLDIGMFGMALATTISYFLATLTVCTHFRKESSSLRLVPVKKCLSNLSGIVLTGAPTALSRVCDTVKIMALNNIIVVAVSVGAVAAFNVRTQAQNFFGSLVMGFAQAAVPIFGMFYGEEDKGALKILLKTVLKTGTIVCSVAAAIIFLIAPLFTSMMGIEDAETLNMATTAVRFFAIGLPVYYINVVMLGYYQSTRNTGKATAICIMQSLVYTLLFALILVKPLSHAGIWIAFLLADVFTVVSMFVMRCIKQRCFSLKIEDLMCLPERFNGSQSRLDISIGNSMDEVMNVSRGIYRFFEGVKIEKRSMDIISLSIEEMAGNIVTHSFENGEKKWLDMMVLRKEDSVVIRLRDNGKPFDVSAYINKLHEKDKEKDGMGILLISGLANKLEYKRIMDMNNLTIWVHMSK